MPGELALGLATHYVTGVVLGGAYFALLRRCSLKPNVLAALGFGAASTLLPLLVVASMLCDQPRLFTTSLRLQPAVSSPASVTQRRSAAGWRRR